jgi:hypothetical protein
MLRRTLWLCVVWILASVVTIEIVELIADGPIGP